MLEKFKGKKVKLLVSSNSGAGTGSDANGSVTMVSSIITIFGELVQEDVNFIELSNARTIYMDSFQKVGFGKEVTPAVIDNSTVIVNRNNIITIAIIN